MTLRFLSLALIFSLATQANALRDDQFSEVRSRIEGHQRAGNYEAVATLFQEVQAELTEAQFGGLIPYLDVEMRKPEHDLQQEGIHLNTPELGCGEPMDADLELALRLSQVTVVPQYRPGDFDEDQLAKALEESQQTQVQDVLRRHRTNTLTTMDDNQGVRTRLAPTGANPNQHSTWTTTAQSQGDGMTDELREKMKKRLEAADRN